MHVIKSYAIRFSVRELYADRVLMIFMIRHKSYMRVTSVTLHTKVLHNTPKNE